MGFIVLNHNFKVYFKNNFHFELKHNNLAGHIWPTGLETDTCDVSKGMLMPFIDIKSHCSCWNSGLYTWSESRTMFLLTGSDGFLSEVKHLNSGRLPLIWALFKKYKTQHTWWAGASDSIILSFSFPAETEYIAAVFVFLSH